MKLTMKRMAAYLIDIVLLFAVLLPLGLLVQWSLGLSPQTGPEIALAILWNFSLPSWLYFIISDTSSGGATIGKRLLLIKVSARSGRVGFARALLRTAVKLFPWELVHISMFALSDDLGQLSFVQLVGLNIANVLLLIYLLVLVVTRGRRSVHDLLVSTAVTPLY